MYITQYTANLNNYPINLLLTFALISSFMEFAIN